MAKRPDHTSVRWNELKDCRLDPLPEDHPWPKREDLTLRVYSVPLGCEHLAFSIGHLEPGQSVEHHRHKDAEEIYVLIRGRAQIRVGDKVLEAEPFDAFRIPADVERSVYNHSEEECWWLFMGAPIDEYLENSDYNPAGE